MAIFEFIHIDEFSSTPKYRQLANSIIEAIQKKIACQWIDKGIVRYQSTNHTALLNFGDGTCDNAATISIDGNTPRDITLP